MQNRLAVARVEGKSGREGCDYRRTTGEVPVAMEAFYVPTIQMSPFGETG